MKEELTLIEKINKIRLELSETKIEKSGHNSFAGFRYFELSDILPQINKLNNKYGVVDTIKVLTNTIILELTDGTGIFITELPFAQFTTPLNKDGKPMMQDVQYLGSLITYYRRYLYLTAYNITEGDIIASLNQREIQDGLTAEYQNQYIEALSKCKTVADIKDVYNGFADRLDKVFRTTKGAEQKAKIIDFVNTFTAEIKLIETVEEIKQRVSDNLGIYDDDAIRKIASDRVAEIENSEVK